jgi:maltooligosyltrehalose trehalohydrolase
MSDPVLPFERPLGARPTGDGGTEFRVWAPRPERIALRADGRDHELADAGLGVREAVLPVPPGGEYAYVIAGVELPDPASRAQPHGLRGPSLVLDPGVFEWTDDGFVPPDLADSVIYELHVGTFTPEGTFDAVIPHLGGLRELGITTIELLPVAEFPGAHGWGYDGVYLSAAHSAYGGPPALQRLVDAAHAEGLAVLLDVVYNHVGASGAQALEAFGPYFTDMYETVWGKAMNYDDGHCGGVREWVLQSAEGWIRDFHFDGLRLDAIHAILDGGAVHLVQALCARVHALAPRALVIAESGMNDPKVVRSHERGGWGCDAVWADDFHHALRVLLTGDRDGYYAEFGDIAHLAKAYRRPHVHDGGYSSFRARRFGARADDVAPERFVVFDQNHDQIGNRAFGDRLPPEARPLAAMCTLLSPFTPMLFQGEEHGEAAPFLFFADHIDEAIVVATREGRRQEFAAFAEFAGEEVPDPQDPATFERSKLTRGGEPEGLRELYARLLEARREIGPAHEAHAEFDEHQGWLKLRRGEHLVLANFSRNAVHVPVDRAVELELATHHATVEPGHVVLPPLAGALVR